MAVEEKRVAAVQAVAEKARQGAERVLVAADDEIGRARVANADAVAEVMGIAVGGETRMQRPVDHQHRPGLGSILWRRTKRGIRFSGGDMHGPVRVLPE